MGHLTLSELTQIIKSTLDSNLEPSYWIIAEIGEIRITQKGHCYLELVEKEDDQITSKLRANIWSYTYRNLSTWFHSMTGQNLQQGMKILANAVVQYHEVFGLSLVIRDIDPNFTLGEREKRRREIIDQLIKDGIFDMNRDLSLPVVPQNVAVISSESAAGLEDFLSQLNQNPGGYRLQIRLYKAVMQGREAKDSIIHALHQVFEKFQEFDVVVLIRGGGSQVDLDCFDSYELASHIAQFPLPVITGIGHERDETIVDLVAHTKMKTPTAVSEFLLNGFRAYEERMDSALQRLRLLASGQITGEKQFLEKSLHRLILAVNGSLNAANQSLENSTSRIATAAIQSVRQNVLRLESIGEKLATFSRLALSKHQKHLEHLEHSLHLLDPKQVLKKGYTITLVNNQPIDQAAKISKKDKLTTKNLNWKLESTVSSVEDTSNGQKEN